MFKAAVIGAGWVGLAHASGYQSISECSLVGCADPVRSLGDRFIEKYGGNAYESINDLLEREKPDIISVCTPPSFHFPVVRTSLSHGVKYIVCEKPLAHNAVDARKIVEEAKSSGALLMTAFCHRFVEPVQKMKDMIDAGELGEVVFFRNEFSSRFEGVQDRWFSQKEVSGGGTIMDTSVHSIDLFRFLCGEVKNVNARVMTNLPGLKVEDSSCLLLQSERGCIGILEASWNLPVGRADWEICGAKGRAHYEYWGAFRIRLEKDPEWRIIPVERDINRRFEDELRHFINAIRGEEKLGPDGEQGLRANEVIEAAYQSVKQEKWIAV
ncbi:Gfo/Idh/MocA family oxidoreductase [Candidatus Sumerlaeota bacterium]|nr:Gfo/Idh/MocA family oxidoreductase [Candidatus Sumerlaeota bacterium]